MGAKLYGMGDVTVQRQPRLDGGGAFGLVGRAERRPRPMLTSQQTLGGSATFESSGQSYELINDGQAFPPVTNAIQLTSVYDRFVNFYGLSPPQV